MSGHDQFDFGDRPSSYDPAAPLVATGNLRRRKAVSKLTEWGATGAAGFAIVILGIVLYSVISRGAPAINWDFLTKGAPEGVAPALVGTVVIVAIATAMATPLGILIALYMNEYAGRRSAELTKMTMDVMNGLPAIIIGLFIFILLVEGGGGQSAFKGSIALAIIMLPLIARGTQEVLALVPSSQREAADALGVARWRTIITIILPAAIGGILTATTLSVARAAGETAPLILVSSIGSNETASVNPTEALSNIPVRIFTLSEEANPEGFTEAWGLALILVVFILIASLGARMLLARSKRKMSQ
jgi:phosphate transport system permease protein